MKADWLEEFTPCESLEVLEELSTLFAARGGAVGAHLLGLIKDRDWASLLSTDLQLTGEHDVHTLLANRQLLAFYEKLDFLTIPGVDKEAVAFAKFVESESRCSRYNTFFRCARRGSLSMNRRDSRILYAAARKIALVLGKAPTLEQLSLKHGPGATTSIKKRDASIQRKFAQGIECSEELLNSGYLPGLLQEMPSLSESNNPTYSINAEGETVECHDVGICHGRLEFVPKNAKSLRTILVEPSLNTMFQAGIRGWMTSRLKRFGIDISDQTINGNFAKFGSRFNTVSTLDLSSASDNISLELVKFLLPLDWYQLLSAARTGTAVYCGTSYSLQKFSSMGNGFTFPLETLIFWALTICSCKPADIDLVSVYGDDIICPRNSAADVISTLELCGFQVNTEKSFIEGPFRESCGKDYYKGIDVRPVYLKHQLTGESLFVLHNFFCSQFDTEAVEIVLRHIHPSLRIFGPAGYGDGHLHGDYAPAPPSFKALRKGYAGTRFDTFTRCAREHPSLYRGDYVSPIYSVYAKARTPILEHNLKLMTSSSAAKLSFLLRGCTNVQLCERDPVSFERGGSRPLWPLPGSDGYKRTSIYTFLR